MTGPRRVPDFLSDALEAAPRLLGWSLVRTLSDGGEQVCRIVEAEAYRPDDAACHSFHPDHPDGRRTARNASMFLEAGYAYIYRIHQVHCLNISTDGEGRGEAVLIRGADGLTGCHGPGRLCRALSIDLEQDGLDLFDPASPLRLEPPGEDIPEEDIIVTTRRGINRAVELPWRFYVRGSPGVSHRDRAAESKRNEKGGQK